MVLMFIIIQLKIQKFDGKYHASQKVSQIMGGYLILLFLKNYKILGGQLFRKTIEILAIGLKTNDRETYKILFLQL